MPKISTEINVVEDLILRSRQCGNTYKNTAEELDLFGEKKYVVLMRSLKTGKELEYRTFAISEEDARNRAELIFSPEFSIESLKIEET